MATENSTITTVVHSISQDLIFEILLKLPAKSVFRFRSVSKSWRSIIISQQFIDSFMSRPRLLLIMNDFDHDRVLFFSSRRQICSLLSSSSMLVAENNMPEVKSCIVSSCDSVRGLVFFRLVDGFAVCNPATGQFKHLANNDIDTCCYLGYDPKSNQYKVLRVLPDKSFGNKHSVLTLGGQPSSQSWRQIKANIPDYKYYQCNGGVCIDGVVYYLCRNKQNHFHNALCCFDVGSEQLRLIEISENLVGYLTNYLGKLAVYREIENGFSLWVLDDIKNQVWSNKTCVFPSFTSLMLMDCRFEGITAFGEIVYVTTGCTYGDSVKLFCYDIEKKMERRVVIEGHPKSCRFYTHLLCSYADNIIYL